MFLCDEGNTSCLDSQASDFSNITPSAYADATAVGNLTLGSKRPDTMDNLRFICEVCITMPIAVAGILGNLVSIFVLRQYRPAMTTTTILQCLAWTDTAYLTGSVVLRTFRYIGIPNYDTYSPYIFFWLYPTIYGIRLTDTWLTVLLTVDRFIAVCYPLHANRLCSRAKTNVLIVIIVLCSFAFSVPRYFEYIIIVPSNHTMPISTPESPMMKDPLYTFIYRVSMFFIVMYLVPMTTVTILNTQLLITFRRSAKNRATSLCVNSFSSSHSSSSDRSFSTKPSSSSCSSSSSSCSITRMVTAVSVTVVLISIATDTVAMLSYSFWSIVKVFPHLTNVVIYSRYLANIGNVAVTLRCAVNFVVYCAVSRQFRVVLFRSFVCHSATSPRGVARRQLAATAAGRQSSKGSDNISTSILSFISGLRLKGSAVPHGAEGVMVVAEENVAEPHSLNHVLIRFVKR